MKLYKKRIIYIFFIFTFLSSQLNLEKTVLCDAWENNPLLMVAMWELFIVMNAAARKREVAKSLAKQLNAMLLP
jgi:hypothetical protein